MLTVQTFGIRVATKLFQVCRVLVFGSSGAVHREPMKTFTSKVEADEFQKTSQDLLAEAIRCRLMHGNAALDQPASVGDTAERLIASLGIKQIHTVVVELPVEEERRIHVPQLVMGSRH